MKKLSRLLLYFFVISLAGCQVTKVSSNSNSDDRTLYREAMANAVYPEESKIDKNLIAISPDNKALTRKIINGEEYILVVSWKQNVSYYKNDPATGFYNTGKYNIWITTSPQLLEWMKQSKTKDVNLRLKQLLGLPPNATYSYFVEFWVKPSDLFRPCPDKEINDKQCGLCFPDGTDEAYKNWINQSRIDRYYQCNLYDQYPWTQLGYTYDWNPENKSHRGLSEFVIDVNKNIIVNQIYTTEEYLNKEL